jgi:hypothetical protein
VLCCRVSSSVVACGRNEEMKFLYGYRIKQMPMRSQDSSSKTINRRSRNGCKDDGVVVVVVESRRKLLCGLQKEGKRPKLK